MVSALVLAACVNAPQGSVANEPSTLSPRATASSPKLATPDVALASQATLAEASHRPEHRPSAEQYGTGEMFRSLSVAPSRPVAAGAPVSLSFENGDVREIVRNVLGDLLNENYIIDSRVSGTVTMRTTSPIPRADVLPLLETVLRSSGFALVRDGNYLRVLPAADAVRGNAVPIPANAVTPGRGSAVLVYTVKNIGAKELFRVLEPFAKDPATSLKVDELRNLLFISGPQVETDRLVQIAEMFDVNILKGMSFVLVTLQSSDVKTVLSDYEKIVGGAAANPFGGLLRVLPIERMNAILLVSPQAEVVREAKMWIERLDAGGGDSGSGQRLFVYPLQYTQAERLQPVLQAAISGRSAATVPGATVAPGQQARTMGVLGTGNTLSTAINTNTSATNNNAATAASSPIQANQIAGAGGSGSGTPLARNVTIVADKDRNSLLIVATQAEYNAIESVIKKLDVAPKQVAIEVQIAEVSLTGDFAFGLTSYLQGKLDSSANKLSINNGVGAVGAAFKYTWTLNKAAQAVLDASETRSRIRTLSQPTLITLENQKATFGAETQISVKVGSTTTANGSTATTDNFQYINTGTTISVTPRVSGGNVFLEIQQEISDAGTSSDGSNPPITRRSSNTNVMVPSGDTMLLGGLFQEGGRNSSAGLPFLSSIPVIGGAFGKQGWQSNRTELVLLITPRILSSVEDTRSTVDELRRGMKSIEELLQSASTGVRPANGADRQRLTDEAKQKLADDIRQLNGSMKSSINSAP
jgi:general secretion pathway protein D